MRGEGVEKNFVEAYKWLDLAGSQANERAADVRLDLAKVERILTPEQVAQAQQAARAFKPHKPSATAESPATTEAFSSPATANPATLRVSEIPARGTGTVMVIAEDESAEVFVDGSFVGNPPTKLKLAEGKHTIAVKKVGFKDYEREINVADGAELTLRPVLDK